MYGKIFILFYLYKQKIEINIFKEYFIYNTIYKMSDFPEKIPRHINIKKTRGVVEIVQAPVTKIVSRKIVTETIVPGKYKTIVPACTTKEINHQIIDYNNNQYIVGYCPYVDNDILFVIDYINEEQYKKFINRDWHYRSDGGYIASTAYGDDNNKKDLYLHNYVMDKLTFNGKGQHHSLDHINRVGRDNRKCNLRELSQSHQNMNQVKRKRDIVLPENCNIDADNIPKNIYFKPGSGAHGDQFYIEIRTPDIVSILCKDDDDKKRFRWFGTKSKTLDLRVKLQHAINKLEELRKEYPSIADLIYAVENVQEKNELISSFNDILELTTYPKHVIEKNKGVLLEQIKPIPIEHVQEQLVKEIEEKTIRGIKSHLPEDCGITPQMIPKHCYYKPESDTRGCKFIIDRHPKLLNMGKRLWATTESKKITIKQKFDLLLEKLNELNS